MRDVHEFIFDVPAMTAVRVRAASREDTLAEIGELQGLNRDLVYHQTTITELSLYPETASLVEVDDERDAGDECDETCCRSEDCDGDPNDGEGWDGFCGNCADRRDPTFYVTVSDDSVGSHEVGLDDSGDFICHDCGATGCTTGFTVSESGAQEWHDSL